ncbi:MAG: cytochrome c biogenesis heme-transporting ATPase CcmA [Pseudomonadota bacterium]
MSYDTRTELQIDSIAFERNYCWLFSGISTTLSAGETLLVQGMNGTGKSTLLRMLAGYIEPAQGDIFWRQKSIRKLQMDYQQQLHYLGHQNGLKPTLTVMENLRLNMALAGKKFAATAAQQILEELAIANLAKQTVNQLSAGQCRRAALARLLLNPCQLWLLDEPTTALDVEGQAVLTRFMNQHTTHGGIIVLVAHQELGVTGIMKKIAL